eukprot:scaffold208110_cov27-Tisochrysis_lutea.AAC.1
MEMVIFAVSVDEEPLHILDFVDVDGLNQGHSVWRRPGLHLHLLASRPKWPWLLHFRRRLRDA